VLSLTRKTDYALVALTHMATSGAGRMSARKLSFHLDLPLPVLMNILNQLGHAGLVRSVRGANGGFGLARPPAEISLTDVIEAVEGPVRLTLCCPDLQDGSAVNDELRRCELEPNCAIKAPIRRVHRLLRSFLSQVTLDQIVAHDIPVKLELALMKRNREMPEVAKGSVVPLIRTSGIVAKYV